MRLLLVTVGTSLLTNRDDEASANARPWSGRRREDPLPAEAAADAYLVGADPRLASAETNTLASAPLMDGDRLALLHSDTDDGRWCSGALARLYTRLGHAVVERRIEQLGYRAAPFAERGLRGLLSAAFEEMNKARAAGAPVVICATGGFKAETAFLYLVGLLTGTPVLYIHELFREPVWMPALPIAWDLGFVERNASFFQWIDAEPRTVREVEPRLRAEPRLRELTAEGDDGCVYLTAAGDLLVKAHGESLRARSPAVWPPDSRRTPSDKNMLSGVAHHRPDGWAEFIGWLTRVGPVEAVRYDASGAGRHGPTGIWRQEPPEVLHLVYARDDLVLPLRVETTARTDDELRTLSDWLSREVSGRFAR